MKNVGLLVVLSLSIAILALGKPGAEDSKLAATVPVSGEESVQDAPSAGKVATLRFNSIGGIRLLVDDFAGCFRFYRDVLVFRANVLGLQD